MLRVTSRTTTLLISTLVSIIFLLPGVTWAGEAQVVVDASSGTVLYEKNSSTSLHPAGVVKLMTLYLAFKAIRENRISMSDSIEISDNAAAEPAERLGLIAGSEIELRYLIRATAVQGANDAATALAEAVADSEQDFVELMNTAATAIGLTNTKFKNAHGLTQEGATTTALDVGKLALALNNDFPEYMNILGRRATDAGIKLISHSGSDFFEESPHIYAVKTGHTKEAQRTVVVFVYDGPRQLIFVDIKESDLATQRREVTRLMEDWMGR